MKIFKCAMENDEGKRSAKAFDYKDAVSYAMIFQRQIRKKQEESGGKDWTWEVYLPGPIAEEEAEIIMGIAGCWCDDSSEDSVRFYTNQSHPSWIRERHLYF